MWINKYAPEPWRMGGRFKGQLNGLSISAGKYFVCVVPGNDAKASAVRSRIIACVNACRGIDPKELSELLVEADTMAEYIDRCKLYGPADHLRDARLHYLSHRAAIAKATGRE